jgi:hypothetical protein
VVGAVPFLLPLLWQTKFGWSPVKSGAVAAFVFVGNVGIKPATTPLINRFGFRSPLPVIALISGVTRSAALTIYSTTGFADMPADQMRDASTP